VLHGHTKGWLKPRRGACRWPHSGGMAQALPPLGPCLRAAHKARRRHLLEVPSGTWGQEQALPLGPHLCVDNKHVRVERVRPRRTAPLLPCPSLQPPPSCFPLRRGCSPDPSLPAPSSPHPSSYSIPATASEGTPGVVLGWQGWSPRGGRGVHRGCAGRCARGEGGEEVLGGPVRCARAGRTRLEVRPHDAAGRWHWCPPLLRPNSRGRDRSHAGESLLGRGNPRAPPGAPSACSPSPLPPHSCGAPASGPPVARRSGAEAVPVSTGLEVPWACFLAGLAASSAPQRPPGTAASCPFPPQYALRSGAYSRGCGGEGREGEGGGRGRGVGVRGVPRGLLGYSAMANVKARPLVLALALHPDLAPQHLH